MSSNNTITSFEIRELIRNGFLEQALQAIKILVEEECGFTVDKVQINDDSYSLNSVNGLIIDGTNKRLFFKFHTEEGEAESIDEYYRGNILAKFGFPVDIPLYASQRPGKQFLLYKYREDRRLAEVALDLERGTETSFSASSIISAQEALDKQTLDIAIDSMSKTADTIEKAKTTALHQLFHTRLVDPDDSVVRLGGRYNAFYSIGHMSLHNSIVPWKTLETKTWIINGVKYRYTLRELFEKSLELLEPARLASMPTIVSHGDAHNANIWVEATESEEPQLVLFDPAFAGDDIPSLLGEIKATFHNIFAHPFWLYSPNLVADNFKVRCWIEDQTVHVEHNWQLGSLRAAFFDSKIYNYWIPLLRSLKSNAWLPDDWQDVMRSALFCCPMLVMNMLPSRTRSLEASILGLSLSVAAGSPPLKSILDKDIFVDMFERIQKDI